MDRITKSFADETIADYKDYVQKQINKIYKNFGEMDLDNANVKDDFEGIINEMVLNCQSIINEIEQYNFY